MEINYLIGKVFLIGKTIMLVGVEGLKAINAGGLSGHNYLIGAIYLCYAR